MAEQKQTRPSKADVEEPEVEAKDLRKEFNVDDILDEIDDVLEENAEEFVKGYIQKGGE